MAATTTGKPPPPFFFFWRGMLPSLHPEVTPRFSDGLTVIDAYGQFLNSSVSIDREDTKILILIYPSNQNKEKAIEEIINLYKSSFQQESVLRVTSIPARVSF